MLTDKETLLYICRVVKVVDDEDGLRIKARLPGYDDVDKVDEWPWLFPLLPKHLHVNPKINEAVLVILQRQGATNGLRFFIGPLISQPYMLSYDDYFSSKTFLDRTNNIVTPEQSVKMDPENNGSLPEREDIAIQGRSNTDIVLKDNEIRIRCGHKLYPNSNVIKERLHYNKKNPAYIQLKYRSVYKQNDPSATESIINIVADKIKLLTHGKAFDYNLSDRDYLISDETVCEKTSHPLPYGDVLVGYLKTIVKILLTHTHPYSMLPPTLNSVDSDKLNNITMQADNELLTKDIKIN